MRHRPAGKACQYSINKSVGGKAKGLVIRPMAKVLVDRHMMPEGQHGHQFKTCSIRHNLFDHHTTNLTTSFPTPAIPVASSPATWGRAVSSVLGFQEEREGEAGGGCCSACRMIGSQL